MGKDGAPPLPFPMTTPTSDSRPSSLPKERLPQKFCLHGETTPSRPAARRTALRLPSGRKRVEIRQSPAVTDGAFPFPAANAQENHKKTSLLPRFALLQQVGQRPSWGTFSEGAHAVTLQRKVRLPLPAKRPEARRINDSRGRFAGPRRTPQATRQENPQDAARP